MPAPEATAAARCVAVTSLGEWAPAWDKLVATAPVPTPFLRSWWLDAVGQRNSELLLFVEGSELIGGLAIERRGQILGVPVYGFCGSGPLCPDHLDVLAAPGREAAVCHALRQWWTRPGCRVLDLDGLVENSIIEATFGSSASTVWGSIKSGRRVRASVRQRDGIR
jgi:hypothetical protein